MKNLVFTFGDIENVCIFAMSTYINRLCERSLHTYAGIFYACI